MGVLLQTVQTKRANQHEQPHIFLKNRISNHEKRALTQLLKLEAKKKTKNKNLYRDHTLLRGNHFRERSCAS